ncbi:MAG TPA: SDR family NAD(P)-dependent oxidoreductase, partial [Solirubrobacteraceae bacterium]
QGKRVLISGASSGVGVATACAFARAGADVALLARRREGLEVAARAARASGGRAVVVPADVTDREALTAAVDEAARQLGGGLDVVVSNHAGMLFGTFEEVSPEDFDATIATTFTGAVNLVRAAMPHLERSSGAIVLTGSIMGKVPLPTFASYVAAKHALRGFAGSLRVELRRRRSPVSISIVNPGAIDTPLWSHVSSATGRLPRNPPDLYRPDVIARGLVAAAIRPRPEITIGGEARIVELGWAFARPLAEWVLTIVSRFYASGKRPAPPVGLLRGPTGEGEAAGGLHGRPSLWAPIRLGRPYRHARH